MGENGVCSAKLVTSVPVTFQPQAVKEDPKYLISQKESKTFVSQLLAETMTSQNRIP